MIELSLIKRSEEIPNELPKTITSSSWEKNAIKILTFLGPRLMLLSILLLVSASCVNNPSLQAHVFHAGLGSFVIGLSLHCFMQQFPFVYQLGQSSHQ